MVDKGNIIIYSHPHWIYMISNENNFGFINDCVGGVYRVFDFVTKAFWL